MRGTWGVLLKHNKEEVLKAAYATYFQLSWFSLLGIPGNDLLSRVLRRSTIGAGAFHDRVRNGIGCSHSAIITR